MKLEYIERFVRSDLLVHIYSEALIKNVSVLKGLCRDGTKFCAAVKANAYGHGITEVVNILKDGPVDFFAVANVLTQLPLIYPPHSFRAISQKHQLLFGSYQDTAPTLSILHQMEYAIHLELYYGCRLQHTSYRGIHKY